jgi:hypothetical protein
VVRLWLGGREVELRSWPPDVWPDDPLAVRTRSGWWMRLVAP